MFLPRLLILLAILEALTVPARSARLRCVTTSPDITRVSGPISSKVTWSGNIRVTGDIVVLPGAELSILPGTHIECREKSDDQLSGMDKSLVEIRVEGGKLNAAGAADQPIVFTSSNAQSPAPGDWFGVSGSFGEVTMSHCLVEYAVHGLSLERWSARDSKEVVHFRDLNHRIDHCIFRRNQQEGIRAKDVALILSDCTVSDNLCKEYSAAISVTYGPYVPGARSVALKHCTLSGNQTGLAVATAVLIHAEEGIPADLLSVVDSEFHHNGYALEAFAQTTTLSGCAFEHDGTAVFLNDLDDPGQTSVSNCTVHDNTNGVVIHQNYHAVSLADCKVFKNTIVGLQGSRNKGGITVVRSRFDANGNENSEKRPGPLGDDGASIRVPSGRLTVSDTQISGGWAGVIAGELNMDKCAVVGQADVGAELSAIGKDGITGNLIARNRVGVRIRAGQPIASGSMTGNDIFANKQYEVENLNQAGLKADGNYWGEPTSSEVRKDVVNLTKIYDSRDNPDAGQVVISKLADHRLTVFALPDIERGPPARPPTKPLTHGKP